MADLQGRNRVQVRNALLDLKTAADQVAVARDNVDLAGQTLVQARDRFAAGSRTTSKWCRLRSLWQMRVRSLISSIYIHNLAKVQLARAVGMTETTLKEYMGGAPSGSTSRGN